MVVLRVVLLFGAFVIIIPNLNESKFVAVKCCPRGEELDKNFTNCTPVVVNNTSESVAVAINNTDSLIDVMNSTTTSFDIADDNASLSDMSWLPEHVQNEVDAEETEIWDRELDCGDGRAVRLTAPRDENRFRWLRNGSMALRSRTARGAFEERVFEPGDDFCADTFSDESGVRRRVLLLCACHRLQCIAKCCPLGEAMVCDRKDCDCHKYDGGFNPLHPDLQLPDEDFAFEVVIDQNITCHDGYEPMIDAFAGYPYYMIQKFWSKLFEDTEVCGDMIAIWYAAPRQGLMRCMRPFPFPKLAGLAHWLHVPEAFLLTITLAVIVVVPRRRISVYSYVHDLAMVGHAASLLGRSLLWPPFIKQFIVKCTHIPIAIYFFSVAASFWLNVICINMVCGFWKPLGPQRGSSGRARTMFWWYSTYAWGASAAMTAFTTVMWYARDVPPGMIRPTLHETRTCFRENEAEGKVATFAYYYGPMAGLLAANALLFSSTAVRVRQLSRHAAVLGHKHASSAGNAKAFRNERSLMIYVKLLWLMGVVETGMEIATWASHINEFYNAIVASCVDVLRAVAIFVMCCCKRRVLLALRDRACACAALRHLHACCCRRCSARPAREVNLSEVRGRSFKEAPESSFDTEVTLCDSSQVSFKEQ